MARRKKKKEEPQEESWSWEPEEPIEEEYVEEPSIVEEAPVKPKKLYATQMKFGLERWQDASATVELLGNRVVKIGNTIATPTATVRGGWRYFEGSGVILKLRESDWQLLIA
jgi:hypothetical protein